MAKSFMLYICGNGTEIQRLNGVGVGPHHLIFEFCPIHAVNLIWPICYYKLLTRFFFSFSFYLLEYVAHLMN